jgi:hypothetical protein
LIPSVDEFGVLTPDGSEEGAMRTRAVSVVTWSLVLTSFLPLGCCSKQSKETAGWLAAAQASPAKKVGVFDGADCQNIRGWAWNPKRPDEAVKVDLYDGDKLITTVTADDYRKDLEDVGLGNGKHAFEMAPPAALNDGTPHAIHARFSGTAYGLNTSPRTYICSEDSADSPPPLPAERHGPAGDTKDARLPKSP